MTPANGLVDIAVILTDAQGRILWVNSGFTALTGYSLQEAVSHKPGRLLQGDGTDPADVVHIRRALEAKISFQHEILNYRKDGRPYQCRLVIHPIFDHNNNLCNFIAFEVDGEKADQSKLPLPLLKLDDKYTSSSLKGVDEVELYLRLKEYMEREQPYLDPNMTLKGAAEHLNTNTKYLSQVVNHLSYHNFQYFINTFRVEEAKRKLLCSEYDHLTLYGIGLQCGFKNKSTFYKVFKEVTGMTPRDYIRHHRDQVV